MATRATRFSVRQGDRDSQKCLSQKRCYATKAEALDAAELLMESGRVYPGCHITPYECPDCRMWHVANRRIVQVR